MGIKPLSMFQKKLISIIQHYNHDKYWKRRAICIDPNNKTPYFVKLWYLLYIKRVDAYHNCSFGTNINSGSYFEEPPHLPHGPKNIIIGHNLRFGRNCTIFHNVTISGGGGIVGDNVLFSTGCTILSTVTFIGDNAKIGANCVVIDDVPANATVVMHKPRVIIREN